MKFFLTILFASVFFQTSFYTLSVPGIDNSAINFSNFNGKKVLIVNCASASKYNNQLESLQRLYNQYKDNLVVIAFPSNSFGNEPMGDSAIRAAMQVKGFQFLVAKKSEVTGATSNDVFKWLADKQLNGRGAAITSTDFKKYLVDKNGMITNVFGSILDPMDSLVQKAIISN